MQFVSNLNPRMAQRFFNLVGDAHLVQGNFGGAEFLGGSFWGVYKGSLKCHKFCGKLKLEACMVNLKEFSLKQIYAFFGLVSYNYP